MAKTTVLMVSKNLGLFQGHHRMRLRTDVPVGPAGEGDGPPSDPSESGGPVSIALNEPQQVSRVSVNRDAHGNLHITLEE